MTTPTPTQGIPLQDYIAGQIAEPTLPTGASFTPTLLDTNEANLQATGQLMNQNAPGVTIGANAPVVAPVVAPAPTINTVNGTAQAVDPNAALNMLTPNTGTYDATKVGNDAPQATAQQGIVNANSTVAGQLQKLYSESQPGMVPEWAKGAVTNANDVLAARGLGASTIGAGAIAAAIQQSALPIAAQDASTYFKMDLTNLSNRQQTEFENLRIKQQSLLSDQAADNAAKQFNASSKSQTEQFMSTLVNNIMTQNADRMQAMSQFNVGQENQAAFQNVANSIQIDSLNSQQKLAVDTFNEQQRAARDTFNAQAAFAIEQSNVLWRRNINTENTAATNAAAQTNVQNMFNLSQTAQNQLWQQWRDEASWAFQSSENQKNREYNLSQSANQNYIPKSGFNWGSAAGALSGILLK